MRAPWAVCADRRGWTGKLCEAPEIKRLNSCQYQDTKHVTAGTTRDSCFLPTSYFSWFILQPCVNMWTRNENEVRYVQTPWRCCWQTSLEPWHASLVWVWDFQHTLTADTCSSSRDQHLSACQRFRCPPGCPGSPYRNTWGVNEKMMLRQKTETGIISMCHLNIRPKHMQPPHVKPNIKKLSDSDFTLLCQNASDYYIYFSFTEPG